MELETDELMLNECRRQIENKLGWEDGEKWSTRDFETLSHKIHDATGVSLSIATLKRIWGKIKYDSKPTSTTLNTLARYLEYEDWRDFKRSRGGNGNEEHKVMPAARAKKLSPIWGISALVVLAGIAGAWLLSNETARAYDPDLFAFSSRKVVDRGVPNSVIFNYDAGAASSSDSIYIQQSWDPRLTTLVARDNAQHTSVYYYPGFFEAKLVVNKQVVREHDLLITTDGWLTAIERPGVPVYLDNADAPGDGIMSITVETITGNNVALQPETPFVGFHYFREFEGATSSDLIFESQVRNDYGKGSGACQYAEIRIQFKGPAIIIPLSVKGCVSNLGFAGIDGKKSDLSAFGRNMSEWVKVRCAVSQNKGELFIDDEPIMKFLIPGKQEDFVGLGFRFQGTGSVDDVKVYEKSGRVIFSDNFN
jgi:hypothetical protein